MFARAERVGQTDLDPSHTLYEVGEATLGAIYDIQATPKTKVGLGALLTASQLPAGLAASYGGQPLSWDGVPAAEVSLMPSPRALRGERKLDPAHPLGHKPSKQQDFQGGTDDRI